MAQPVDQPALRHNLHPCSNARSASANPHQAKVAILKCFEYSAQCWHELRADRLSDVYLRTSSRFFSSRFALHITLISAKSDGLQPCSRSAICDSLPGLWNPNDRLSTSVPALRRRTHRYPDAVDLV